MTAWVDAVGEWLKAVHGGGVHLVGYSMGGRIALRLAHRFPEEICRLTLLSTSPGISNEQERRARRQWDLEMAQQIRSKGMIHFADFWEALPILGWPRAVTRSTYCRAMGERRRLQTPEGIAMAMEWIGAGNVPDAWDLWEGLTVPTSLVVGTEDTKYTALMREMQERRPNTPLHILPQAGHCLHLEAPQALADILLQSPDGGAH